MPKSSPDHGALVDVGLGIIIRQHTNLSQTNPPIAPDFHPTHEILITLRPDTTVFGGYWELPGGKLDPGETIDACVIRELREEVGVEARVTGALPEVIHQYDHAHVRLHPRLCKLAPGSPDPQPLHVEGFTWCALDRLVEYHFPPANETIIDALRAHLA